eukprot:2523603-Pyramimonas_sp.AAC.1
MRVHRSFSLKKLSIQASLDMVATRTSAGFEFKSKRERKQWVEEMGRRLRGICRHVQQYRIKRNEAPL